MVVEIERYGCEKTVIAMQVKMEEQEVVRRRGKASPKWIELSGLGS